MSEPDTTPALPDLTPENYINRELSWLDFNRRVLALAADPATPLLERAKFLAIFSNNLDEFYMVRVASWYNKRKLGILATRPDGYPPYTLLQEIRHRVIEATHQQRIIMEDVFQQLELAGVHLRSIESLSEEQLAAVTDYFADEVFPVLTPLGVDHARPFPFISNLSLNQAVWLQREDAPEDDMDFVRIKIPTVLPRLIDVNELCRNTGRETANETVFVWLEDIMAANLPMLFPGMRVVSESPFRVIRSADIDYEHETEDPFLDMSALIEETVRERQFGSVVRLSVKDDIPDYTLDRLVRELKVDAELDVYRVDGALGTSALFEFMRIDRPDLKYEPYVPRIHEAFAQGKDIFSAIRQNDILLHHPYDSFSPVEEFFEAAAHDPNVLAIKATLYRMGKNSRIVQALAEARENDKQVAVLVELKARFDEENNLEWARVLEHQGVHVTYGVEELPVKTHAKVALVVRREPEGVRHYVHLGTGNYNGATARQYTDIGLFTCKKAIGRDVLSLFNRLTGYAPATKYKRLLVAPEYLQKAFVRLIDNEIEAALAGKPARLIFKMNQLEEDVIIQKLYQASQAGVQVDLIVRGLCCLRPGVPGLSENIRVRSTVGRYLEHSRIYYFQNAPQDEQIYLGSADIMRRNIYNRVEVMFPILDTRIQQKVLSICSVSLADNQNAWELGPDGQYRKLSPGPGEPIYDSQQIFMEKAASEIIQPL